MKKVFIKVRFDRMKNDDLFYLCRAVLDIITSGPGTQALLLKPAFRRFAAVQPLFKFLNPKYRKLPQTVKLLTLRKRLDDLITALLLNLKALRRADFPEIHNQVIACDMLVRSLFKNFTHEGILTKNANLNALVRDWDKKEQMYNDFVKVGLTRYLETIVEVYDKIKNQSDERSQHISQLPKTGITIPSKEEIISELRLLLQTIEITVVTHPGEDYLLLTNRISEYLIEARGQLRNLASRRVTAKAKAKEKKESEETKGDGISEG